tara:strand:+ start:463 stop:1059 length:597 start_codon:yes stop_codon:yes gene_type:complete
MVFLLGLVLVIVGGAESFTGSCLIVITRPDKRVSTVELLRNSASVYLGNFSCSVGSAVLVYFSGTLSLGDSVVQSTAIAIAKGKTALSFLDAFVRGILCNVLACFAVWTSFAALHVAGKVIAIVLPVTAFVTLGFEHLVGNMHYILVAMIAGSEKVDIAESIPDLLPVTLGIIVSGVGLVAAVFRMIYLTYLAKRYSA